MTTSPSGSDSPSSSSPDSLAVPRAPWFLDPLEVDRHLDGEGSAAERSARDADVAVRPEVQAHLAARGRFLAALGGARTAPPESASLALARLEARVRTALLRDRTGAIRPVRGWVRPLWMGAAAALAGLGAWLLMAGPRGGSRDLEADQAVAMAAQVLHWQPQALGTCAQGATDVHGFALVRDGDLQVSGCAEERGADGSSVAALRRPEDLPVVGYVSLPDSGGRGAARHEIGLTELEGGRVVVFDLLDHGRRVYLAVNAAAVRAKHAEAGERWTCAACHGPARQGLDSPHRIFVRKAP